MKQPQSYFGILFYFIIFPAITLGAVRAKEERHLDSMRREYFLYLPEKIDANKTYWLVLGAHGNHGNGKGAAGMAEFVKSGNSIVVGPSYPDTFQGLGAGSAEQTLRLIDELKKRYTLHDRVFVTGFSAGAQFAHRFALAYPERVIGCAANSAGTMATGDMPGDVKAGSRAAALVPMTISCGASDKGFAMPGYPLCRVDFAHKFETTVLQKEGFLYKALYIPNTGHQMTPAARQLTVECFLLSTTGLAADEREKLDGLVRPIEFMIRQGNTAQAKKTIDALPTVWDKMRKELASRRKSSEEVVPGWKGGSKSKEELNVRAGNYLKERIEQLKATLPKTK